MVSSLLLFGGIALIANGDARHDATKEKILAHAEKESHQYCSKLKDYVCELSATRHEDTWWVHLQTVLIEPSGQRLYTLGGDTFYIYSLDGNLIETVPGL